MARIIFINRFFHPDHSATSQILSDLAFVLAKDGRDVQVLASRQIYDRPQARLAAEETVDGVRIHRVATTQYGRSGLLGRAFDYMSFYGAVARRLRVLLEAGDIVVAKTDPPLMSIPVARIAARRGARLVNWLQDIYPEIAAELGIPIPRLLGRTLIAMRNRSLRAADANVALGTGMAGRLGACGVAADRIHIIPNWTEDETVVPVAHADNSLRQAWQLEGKFVVGYSGNLGRAHEFETVLAAASQLREQANIVFLCIGGGKHFETLARRAREDGLDGGFRFLPYQNRDELKYSLGAADVHWISMRPELEGLIFPSKLYGIAAAGRPVLAITPGRGEIAELVRQHGCGAAIDPGDGTGLARSIRRLAADPALCAAMGHRARTMLDTHFSRKLALSRWRSLIGKIEAGPPIQQDIIRRPRHAG